ncbi:DNA helicase II, partial [Francisella tularensis subsp. holarctica]|nr:DNA helicase II [Francisella tularensis subsp. holarctica]
YVAVKRAMRALTISYAKVRSIFGRSSFQVKSRFVTEIYSQHLSQGKLEFTAAKPKNKQKANFGMSPFYFLKSNKTTNSFKPGDKVF